MSCRHVFSSMPTAGRLFGFAAAAIFGLAGLAQNAAAQCSVYNMSTGTGTIVPGTVDTGNHADDGTTNITLPFPVSLYGTSYSSANVCSNGSLQFVDANATFTNNCFPSATFTGPVMAPHWDDLRTDTAGSGIFTAVSGIAPTRTFNIEWRSTYFSGTGGANFEIRLHEGSTSFEYIYGAVDGAGASATVGVEAGGAAGPNNQFECNSGGLTAGLMISFSCAGSGPPLNTLVLNPSSGPAGATFLATSTVTPGFGPPSTGLGVRLDASSVGGGNNLQMFNDGTHGDVTANDNIWSLSVTVSNAIAVGPHVLTATVSDAQARTGTATATFNVSGANDDCGGAIPAMLGDNFFDNSAATDSTPAATCGAMGKDLWFSYTIPSAGTLTVTTCGSTNGDSVIALYDGNCNGAAVACNDDTCGLQSRVSICPASGPHTYLIRVGGFAGQVWTGTFNVAFTAGGSVYTVPAGAVPEGEACGVNNPDTTNGGCNSTPPVYNTATLCTTYVGNAANSTGFRDTDWYRFTLTHDTLVNVTGQAQFAAQWFFLQDICPAVIISPAANNSACTPDLNLSFQMSAGTYIFFCSAAGFDGAAICDSTAGYWFRMSDAAVACSHCGSADFNGDGDVGTDQDIEAFFACLAGSCCPTCGSADFNGDGDVGTDQDIEAFFRVLAGGAC